MKSCFFRCTAVIFTGIFSVFLVLIWPIESAKVGGRIYSNTTLTRNNSPYIVTEDILVSENSTLTIEPGVNLYFNPGISLQIHGSLQAKGNETHRIVFTKISTNKSMRDFNFTALYNEGIRLVDGGNYDIGRLEIFVKGKWGTVCDSGFDGRDAQVGILVFIYLSNLYFIVVI